MYATVRRYVAVPTELLGTLQAHAREIEAVMRGAPGFVAFDLMRTPDGMLAVVVADDEMSAMEADRLRSAWMRVNLPVAVPQTWDVLAGDVLIHAGSPGDEARSSMKRSGVETT